MIPSVDRLKLTKEESDALIRQRLNETRDFEKKIKLAQNYIDLYESDAALGILENIRRPLLFERYEVNKTLAIACSKRHAFKEGHDYIDDAFLILENKDMEYYFKEKSSSKELETASLHYLRGNIIYEESKYPEAIKEYTKSMLLRLQVLGEENHLTARVYATLGNTYTMNEDYDRGAEYLTKALETSKKINGEEHQLTIECMQKLGFTLYRKEEKDYEKLLRQAYELYRKTLGDDHPDTANALEDLTHTSNEDNHKKIESYTKVLESRKRVLGEDHTDLGYSYLNIGTCYESLEIYDQALDHYKRAIEIYTNAGLSETLLPLESYQYIGDVYFVKKQYAEALIWQQRALTVKLKTFGEIHKETLVSYSTLGDIYKAAEKYSKALEMFEKVLEISNKLNDGNSSRSASALIELGRCSLEAKHPDRAKEHLSKALHMRLSRKEYDQKTAWCLNSLMETYAVCGEFGPAIEHGERAREILEKIEGVGHNVIISTMNQLGLVYQRQKNFEKAAEYLERVVLLRTNVLGEDDPFTAEAYNNLAKKALQLHQKALQIQLKQPVRMINSRLLSTTVLDSLMVLLERRIR
eukprot:TRINITY_DN4914_c0_g1_i4.p1 TRINITY_DN4914_c0_g1~~TRINITY_DN4914_c0_g1_i4.p1  ORF type:complete len:583 (+),score=61.42 TRINITY_DN4914_c0_g1_i4:876-2624(+)